MVLIAVAIEESRG